MDIVLMSAALIGFGILVYVLLDGFDLGVGILFLWAPRDADRNVMMSSIAPVWDGNATWLIFGGGVLFAAFPTAYSIVLPALYVPIMVMLLALIFRGVAFEYRLKTNPTHRWVWDTAFWGGSTVVALMQGMMLGAVIEGFRVVNNRYVGGPFDWLTSFSVTTGFALVMGYALLGSTWLIMKTEEATQLWARSVAKPLLLIVLCFILMVSIKTPLEYPQIAQRWFSFPNILWLSPVPGLTTGLALKAWKGIISKEEHSPFWCTIGLFVLSYLGLAISLYPYLVMPHLTFWDLAAPESSLKFVLGVSCFTLPIVFGYTIFVYRVFKGKVTEQKNFY